MRYFVHGYGQTHEAELAQELALEKSRITAEQEKRAQEAVAAADVSLNAFCNKYAFPD